MFCVGDVGQSCSYDSYCHTDCAKAQWPTHKLVCKISKKIASHPSALPKDTLYVPARAYIHWVADFGFASEQEAAKMGGPLVDEPPRNQHGGKRFMCRAILANAGKGQWDPHQGKVVYYDLGGGTAFLYDRRRSVIVRIGPQEPGKSRVHGVEIPFHNAGYRQFAELEVLRERGVQGQLLKNQGLPAALPALDPASASTVWRLRHAARHHTSPPQLPPRRSLLASSRLP
ncbi:hypothetical protein B0H14DRAFT_3783603 [Mycena olivaceomarginata]|nr:hypothetical protein B0H14DRAFT_3783603 [Mycena olivaceomarginata]